MNNLKIAIFCHIYYENGWALIKKHINEIKLYNPIFYVNVSNENVNKKLIQNEITEINKNSIIISTPNKGKDIGGKLALIQLYLKIKQNSDYIVFIHDKLSPQVFYGEKWKNDLLKIIEKENINKILKIFENNNKIGIICNDECISNEYDNTKDEFKTTNNKLLKDYLKRFNFNINEYHFVAGSMFWVRSSIFEVFFKLHEPLVLRAELESGNVLDNETGTLTHSFERVFSWLAINNGYKIFGI